MKFFKVSDELFINLEHVTNVWTREGSKFNCIHLSLSGESNYDIKIEGRAEIERFCEAIGISFDHSFCE